MKEKIVQLRPYDDEVADDVFSILFYGSGNETEAGLMEIPAASYQLVISALDLFAWECSGDDRITVNKAAAILRTLRDTQKWRERAGKSERKC